MRKGFKNVGRPMAALVSLLLLGMTFDVSAENSQKTVSEAVQKAISDAKSTPIPDYEKLQGTDDVLQYRDTVTGDTTSMQSLFEDGQGILFTPGRLNADACQGKTDPRCTAVQIVDKASTQKPTIDPDVDGSVMAGRDDVVDKAEDFVDVSGNGTSVGNCREESATVTRPKETKTCDVRIAPGESTGSTQTCSISKEDIYSPTSLWACLIEEGSVEDATCSVPVVVKQKTTSTLTCWEGHVDPQTRSCPVVVTPYREERHLASCAKPLYRSVVKTCSRKLVVAATATCRPGDVTSSDATNHADLTTDAVAGADTLTVSYACDESKEALVTLAVNAQTNDGTEVVVKTAESIFDVSQQLKDGSVRLTGTTQCEGSACITSAQMRVYEGLGTTHVYSGEVNVRLVFSRFVKTEETDHWTTDCTSEAL